MPSPPIVIDLGLADAAVVRVLAPSVDPLALAGLVLVLIGTFLAYQRDRRDRGRQRDEDEHRRAAERRADEREREAERQRQDQRHQENQLVLLALKATVDHLDRTEALNRAARHGQRTESQHYVLRFAHLEQWMADAGRCDHWPLPPFTPLPLLPQRRADDVPAR